MTPGFVEQYRLLRRAIHQQPELGFEERRTSALVADHLRTLGLEVSTGLGGTGVVGTIRKGSSQRAIGLRADMDALPLQEANDFPHRSRHNGRFHACGHDGHTAMLLGAAERLGDASFDGTVHLIFQPAEEGLGGAQAMLRDGLFERFPCEEIYGMHNMPGLPAGDFAVRNGAFFAGADTFRLAIHGRGGHAAMPHQTIDPIVASAHVVMALQTLVSRRCDPLSAAVVTVGEIRGGSAPNIIPELAELRGSLRYLSEDVGAALREGVDRVAAQTAAALGARIEFDCSSTFPVLVNQPAQTRKAVQAATIVAGPRRVTSDAPPIMGSEDFAWLLRTVPGCYLLIGNGEGAGACMLHNPHYDFNDDILASGIAYWCKLVEVALPEAGAIAR
jgi:hippurate hydrolase